MSNPPCPYCGAELDDESQYANIDNEDVLYACNTQRCVAVAWDKRGWSMQNAPNTLGNHSL